MRDTILSEPTFYISLVAITITIINFILQFPPNKVLIRPTTIRYSFDKEEFTLYIVAINLGKKVQVITNLEIEITNNNRARNDLYLSKPSETKTILRNSLGNYSIVFPNPKESKSYLRVFGFNHNGKTLYEKIDLQAIINQINIKNPKAEDVYTEGLVSGKFDLRYSVLDRLKMSKPVRKFDIPRHKPNQIN